MIILVRCTFTRNTFTSRLYTVFPDKYIYNLLSGHLLGTKSIHVKIGIVRLCQKLKSIYALMPVPKVSQWGGLYLKQTQDSYSFIVHQHPFSL